jgi:hypothetical protein
VVGHGSMFHGIVSSRSVMYRVSERHNLLRIVGDAEGGAQYTT